MRFGIDGLWPLAIKNHEDKLQTVDAEVQQCPPSQLPLSQARDVGEWSSQISPHHLNIAHFAQAQQSPHFKRQGEEARPNGLKGDTEWFEEANSKCGLGLKLAIFSYLHEKHTVVLGCSDEFLHLP